MAAYDYVSLPGAPNIATAGNYAQMLMEGLRNVGQDYQKGQEFQYQQRQRNLFQDPENQALLQDAIQTGNYGPLVQKVVQAGGAPAIGQIIPLLDQQQQTRFYEALRGLSGGGGGGGTQPNTGPETSVHAGPVNITGDFGRGQGGQPRIPYSNPSTLSATGMDSAGAETVRSLTAGIANGVDVPQQKMAAFARALGVDDPDTPLSAGQEQLARRLIGTNVRGPGGPTVDNGAPKQVNSSGYEQDQSNTGQRLPSADSGPPGAVGGLPISPAPSTGGGGFGQPQQQPGQFNTRFNAAYGGQGGGQPSTPIGTLQDAQRADEMARRYNELAAAPRISSQQAQAARGEAERWGNIAKEIRSQLGTYGAPATNPQVQAGLKQYEASGAALGKRIGEAIESGGTAARHTVNVLGVMEDALRRGGDHIFTGPTSDIALKVKQAAANLGFDIQGTTESEVVTKLNSQLAAAAAKAMTARPSQLEFKAFMGANPGLMTSTKGSLYLISVLRQATEQDIGLSRKAMDKRNWDRWGDVEDKFYNDPKNAIRSPFSGKPLSADEAFPGAGAPAGQTQGQTGPGHYRWTPQGLQRMQ